MGVVSLVYKQPLSLALSYCFYYCSWFPIYRATFDYIYVLAMNNVIEEVLPCKLIIITSDLDGLLRLYIMMYCQMVPVFIVSGWICLKRNCMLVFCKQEWTPASLKT